MTAFFWLIFVRLASALDNARLHAIMEKMSGRCSRGGVVQAGKFSIPCSTKTITCSWSSNKPNLPSAVMPGATRIFLGILIEFHIGRNIKAGQRLSWLGPPAGPARGRGDGLRPHLEGGGAAVEICRPRAGHRRYLAVLQGELRQERAMEDWLGGTAWCAWPRRDARAKRALLTRGRSRRRTLTGPRSLTGRRSHDRVHAHAGFLSGATRVTAAADPGSRSRFGRTGWALSITRHDSRPRLPPAAQQRRGEIFRT